MDNEQPNSIENSSIEKANEVLAAIRGVSHIIQLIESAIGTIDLYKTQALQGHCQVMDS